MIHFTMAMENCHFRRSPYMYCLDLDIGPGSCWPRKTGSQAELQHRAVRESKKWIADTHTADTLLKQKQNTYFNSAVAW